MKKKISRKQYTELMESLASTVNTVLKDEFRKMQKSGKLDEEFKAPEKSFKEKVFGLNKAYTERVEKAEKEYYETHRQKFLNAFPKAVSYENLLKMSKAMNVDGFKFPIIGMLRDSKMKIENVTLGDIYWMSYDRESSFSAAELATIEKKTGVNDTYVYTYYYSWRFWCANILRCLFFYKDPWGKEANEQISDLMKEYAPKCPIIALYPDYFKK